MAIVVVSDSLFRQLVEAIRSNTLATTQLSLAISLGSNEQSTAINNNTKTLNDLTSILKKIEDDLNPKPVKLVIQFQNQEPGMPIQLTDSGAGSSAIATPSEVDAAGNQVTVDPASIQWGVSDPSAITVTANNTATDMPATDGAGNSVTIPPGGAQFKAVGTAGHLGAFQATVQDTKNNLNAQDTVTVVGGAATALSINFAPAS